MKNKKKIAIGIMIAGGLLILSAVGLMGYNYYESYKAGEASEEALTSVKEVIEKAKSDGVISVPPLPVEDENGEAEISEPEVEKIPEMTVVRIDGYDYIGYISMPTLERELPVMSDWDYYRLNVAPCRYYGSIFTNDMVIAAHDYISHFRYIINLKPSDPVIFTDMDGVEHVYEVVCTDMIKPYDVSGMLNDQYDLTLYTCTRDGMTRIAVRCMRVMAE